MDFLFIFDLLFIEVFQQQQNQTYFLRMIPIPGSGALLDSLSSLLDAVLYLFLDISPFFIMAFPCYQYW